LVTANTAPTQQLHADLNLVLSVLLHIHREFGMTDSEVLRPVQIKIIPDIALNVDFDNDLR
jgi:hypothetical protein